MHLFNLTLQFHTFAKFRIMSGDGSAFVWAFGTSIRQVKMFFRTVLRQCGSSFIRVKNVLEIVETIKFTDWIKIKVFLVAMTK